MLALDIDKKQYPDYLNLKQKAINVVVNEINMNTDLHIEFEETKTVRKITSIKFYINQNNKAIDEIAITSIGIETDPRQDLKQQRRRKFLLLLCSKSCRTPNIPFWRDRRIGKTTQYLKGVVKI